VSRDGSVRRPLPGSRASDEQPRWSRDGRWILYVEHRTPNALQEPSRLYLVNVSTGKRRGPFASFRPDVGYYGYHDWNELAAWYQPS
jgi:Tol biopolymer transport system component